MKFSIFTHDNPNAAAPGKSFREDNGELVKETTGALSRSKVETINVKTMAAFKELLRTLNADQHLLSGVSEHDHSLALPAAVLVRSGFGKDKATGLPLVARSNAFFAFPNGPGLLCIDSDTNSQNITFDLVWDALIDACPALAGVTAVQATSSSSLVSGSIRSTGIGGLHTFVGVKDATDIPRALDVLHKRLILAGHTRHRISKTGAFLERTLADRALKVPSQPIYVRASVSGKVRQTKQIEVRKGQDRPLNTCKALPNLSVAEQRRFRELINASKSAMLPDMLTQREAFLIERAAELAKSGMSKADADWAAVSMLEAGRLEPGVTIHFSNGDTVSVADILKNVERYHDRTCLDPLEPDYAGGRTVAKFYARPEPKVHSFAHSAGDRGRVYCLGGRAEFDALEMNGKMPGGKDAASISDAALAFIDHEKREIARTQRALDLLELRSGKIVRGDPDKLLKVKNNAD